MTDDLTGLPSGGTLDSHILITSGSTEAEGRRRSNTLKVFEYKSIYLRRSHDCLLSSTWFVCLDDCLFGCCISVPSFI